MLREVALHRALEDARNRRVRELEELQDRSRALRRRLRELTDRLAAMGHVHGRFAPPESPPVHALPAAPEARAEVATEAPPPAPASTPEPRITPMPLRRPEEQYAALLRLLAARYPEGFTTGQVREALDGTEPGKTHSYDAAWTLANTLLRGRVFELAGTRTGPAGAPIRLYRVPAKVAAAASSGGA